MSNTQYKLAETYICGAALCFDMVLLPAYVDELRKKDYRFTRVDSFEFTDIGKEWDATDYDWNVSSCCLWQHASSRIDFRCILDEEGEVCLYGPGGKPERIFQIPDAGVWRKGAKGYGYVIRIRAVGGGLYVCGANRQVYRYIPGERNPLSGHFIDVAGPMRQPPLPKAPGKKSKVSNKRAAPDIILFNDIAGTAEDDIYATGDETWHWNGKVWRKLKLKLSNESLHVIKVLDKDRILIGGDKGCLFLGNAHKGFRKLSGINNNQTITGLEWFNKKLFVATDRGLFTMPAKGGRLVACNTGLKPRLKDTHMLEAIDGVLWSFGFKDLAYLDTNQASPRWVRAHNPDNPPIGEDVAHTTEALAEEEDSFSTDTIPAWVPAAQKKAVLDIGGLIARVGHSGVGEFIAAQLKPFGLDAKQVLKSQRSKRYEVSIPKQGVTLVLQYTGPKPAPAQPHRHPEHWGLAEVQLHTGYAAARDHWQGSWPGGIDPYARNLRQQADKAWGEAEAEDAGGMSYFVDGSKGAAWVVNLQWDKKQRLKTLRVLHLGGYLPWDAEEEDS